MTVDIWRKHFQKPKIARRWIFIASRWLVETSPNHFWGFFGTIFVEIIIRKWPSDHSERGVFPEECGFKVFSAICSLIADAKPGRHTQVVNIDYIYIHVLPVKLLIVSSTYNLRHRNEQWAAIAWCDGHSWDPTVMGLHWSCLYQPALQVWNQCCGAKKRNRQ